MNVSFDFGDRVVVVTGAARGVGRVIVRRFADCGALVVAADRDEPGLLETCESLSAERTESIVADIAGEEGATAVVDGAIKRFGRLDVCVNNAAVAPHTALLDERSDVWDRVHGVNARGSFLLTQRAARAMIDRGGGGRIVNFSSGVSTKGSPGTLSYAASRAATESLTRVAAIELAPHGILVNCVSPGLIDTQPKPLPPRMAASLGRRIPTLPLARPGTADEVAAVVLFLASDAATYITGAVIVVDGGAGLGTRFAAPIVDDDPRYEWVTDHGRAGPG